YAARCNGAHAFTDPSSGRFGRADALLRRLDTLAGGASHGLAGAFPGALDVAALLLFLVLLGHLHSLLQKRWLAPRARASWIVRRNVRDVIVRPTAIAAAGSSAAHQRGCDRGPVAAGEGLAVG